MEISDKIKNIRTAHKITQEQLAELSGINLSTISKYEAGLRNPKPDQLQKIADALGISVNIFLDFNIKTVSDLLSLVFTMDKQLNINFDADIDNEGNYIPETVRLSFQHPLINQKICTYMSLLEKRNAFEKTKDSYTDKKEYEDKLAVINQNITDIAEQLLDDDTPLVSDSSSDGEQFTHILPENGSIGSNAFDRSPTSIRLRKELEDILFDCSINELELIVKIAQTIKDCLQK